MKLSDFRLATEKEIETARKGSKIIGGGIFPWSPEGYHHTLIFMVMDQTFNSPNGYPWEHSTWEWVLFTKHGLLTVYDYKGGWSIGYLYSNQTEDLINEATIFKDALLKEVKKVKISKKQIEKDKVGGTIINPYSLNKRTFNHLILQCLKLENELKELKKEKSIYKIADSMNLIYVITSLYRSAFMTSFLSLEGFLNVVYKLFLKERYRNNIYETRLRNELLPLKILEIDRYCHSFKTAPFTTEDELFKAIQHFIDIRNRFLHSNIYEQMESHLVKVGEYSVLINKVNTEEKYGLPTDFEKIDEIHIMRADKLVEKFVLRILQSLIAKIRLTFTIVHSYYYLPYYWHEKDSVHFPLAPDDYVGIEEIEKFLEKSTKLDKEYYNIDKKRFMQKYEEE